ncbi:MAG: SLC26A/SulP transporter family protein [Acidobacteria bacterium]|nr:SLC26A/SulP transporter family protein [Acidobacteriota bacterium]
MPRGGGAARWLRSELAPARLGRTISSALVVGVLQVVLATSFGALIFSGRLSAFLGAGIGLSLFGTAAVGGAIALLGTQPGTIGAMQGRTAAITAIIAASVAGRLPLGRSPFSTIVLAIGITSVLTGAVLYVVGRMRLGNLVRFVPHPVVGGFLAGTGWLLAKGGVGVMTGVGLTPSNLEVFGRAEVAAKWIPGLAFAAVLVALGRRRAHFLVAPALTAAAIALFFAVLAVTPWALRGAEAGGWLLRFPGGTTWRPWVFSALGDVEWSAIPAQVGEMTALVLVALLAVLFSATGLETILGGDVDLNRELRAAGVGNIAAGLGGGPVGFHFLSFSALADRAGARSRLVGLIAGVLCVGVLLSGGSALSYIPRPVLGGWIAFLGLTFLVDWVYDARSRLPRADYLIVLAILGVIAGAGLVPGVAVGVLLAVVLFVVSYSLTDPIRHTFSGSAYGSSVERPLEHRRILRERGGCLQVIELQGFLFFGTATGVVERVRARAQDAGAPALRFLVVDFRRVTGFDSSAVTCLAKIGKLARSLGFVLVLTAPSAEVRRALEREGIAERPEGPHLFADLDHGLEWCEDEILASLGTSPGWESRPLLARLAEALGSGGDSRLDGYLTRLELPAGRAVVRQGEPAGDVYFLESGKVTVQVDVPGKPALRLSTMGPGAVVGEMPLYTGGLRTASVLTDVPSVLYRASLADIARMEGEDPALAAALHRMFARMMAHRLTESLLTPRLLE